MTLRAVGLITIPEAAEQTGISHWTIRTWARRGRVAGGRTAVEHSAGLQRVHASRTDRDVEVQATNHLAISRESVRGHRGSPPRCTAVLHGG